MQSVNIIMYVQGNQTCEKIDKNNKSIVRDVDNDC